MSVKQPKNSSALLTALTRKKSKAGRKVPRKAHNPNRKARYAKYLAASTCIVCHAVFRTPEYKKAHAASFCKAMTGVNRSRAFAKAAV